MNLKELLKQYENLDALLYDFDNIKLSQKEKADIFIEIMKTLYMLKDIVQLKYYEKADQIVAEKSEKLKYPLEKLICKYLQNKKMVGKGIVIFAYAIQVFDVFDFSKLTKNECVERVFEILNDERNLKYLEQLDDEKLVKGLFGIVYDSMYYLEDIDEYDRYEKLIDFLLNGLKMNAIDESRLFNSDVFLKITYMVARFYPNDFIKLLLKLDKDFAKKLYKFLLNEKLKKRLKILDETEIVLLVKFSYLFDYDFLTKREQTSLKKIYLKIADKIVEYYEKNRGNELSMFFKVMEDICNDKKYKEYWSKFSKILKYSLVGKEYECYDGSDIFDVFDI